MTPVISRIAYGGSSPNLPAALHVVRTSVFNASNGARLGDSSVSRVAVVLITETPPELVDATLAEAELTRLAGIDIVTVGIGSAVDQFVLSQISSYPYQNNMFQVNSLRNISSVVQPVKAVICSGT
jgi:collagen type VI alpha